MKSNMLERAMQLNGVLSMLNDVPALLMMPDKGAEDQAITIIVASAMVAASDDSAGVGPVNEVRKMKARVLETLERVETDLLKLNVKV